MQSDNVLNNHYEEKKTMSRNIHRINRPLPFLVAVSIAFMLIGICSGSIMAQATSTTTNTEMPFTASLTNCTANVSS